MRETPQAFSRETRKSETVSAMTAERCKRGSVSRPDTLEQRAEPITKAPAERFGRRLLDQPERALFLEHLAVGVTFAVAPETQGRGRLPEPDVLENDVG